MVGYQSPVWWKLGPQESYDIMMFAVGFYFLLKWLSTESVSSRILKLAALVYLLPFVGLYVLYMQMRGKKVTVGNLWEAVRERLPYLLVIGILFVAEMVLIVFVIGTNNYSYVGLDETIAADQYIQVWNNAAHANLKWYVRFGILMA